MQQILPNAESAFADVLLTYAQASQVCDFDRPAFAGQELQRVQAGPDVAFCLLT